ncbi:universal stress protein [Lapillicoccus sp.]|uniref:universal stress protein n=1 Tax=Lapillicoccus sp. TaxID=1909287 RepID=UPI0032655E3E
MDTHQHPQAVVVGVDGSVTADLAVAWAAEYAGALRSPLRIVTAYPPDASAEEIRAATDDGRKAGTHALRLAWQHLDDAARSATTALGPDLQLETVPVPGSPTSVLLDESQRAAILVVGSRRLGRVHRVFSVSTGATSAAKAACPVVVVREAVSRSLSGTRVVVGVEGPDSGSAAAFAFEQAHRFGAGLTAVHSWTLNSADLGSLVSPQAQRQRLQTRSQALLDEVLTPLAAAYPDVDVRRYVVEGSAPERLVELSENARLLVVGSRGLSPLSAMVLGSVSREVVAHAHCPVAVIHARSARRPTALAQS